MTAREKYDHMVREIIAPHLKQEGFRRARNRFARWGDDAWQIIDFQASQWGSRDGVSFTINLGVAVEGLPKRSSWDEKRPPSEAAAHLRARIGELIDGRDHWWDFDDTTDENALAEALMGEIREVGFPWLEARRGLDRLLSLIATEPEELGWHDLRVLPNLLSAARHKAAAEAVRAETARRGSP